MKHCDLYKFTLSAVMGGYENHATMR